MIVPVFLRDLRAMVGVADGKGGITSVVEVTFDRGEVIVAATDSHIVACVSELGYAPHEVALEGSVTVSYYVTAESLRTALKGVGRSDKPVYLSFEENLTELVTTETTFILTRVSLDAVKTVSKYAALESRPSCVRYPSVTLDSKTIKKAVTAIHATSPGDTVEFDIVKRDSPLMRWTRERPRGYARVLAQCKWVSK